MSLHTKTVKHEHIDSLMKEIDEYEFHGWATQNIIATTNTLAQKVFIVIFVKDKS